MRPSFATVLGLTEAEIRRYFSPYIAAFSAKEIISPEAFLAKMRHWYNGFCFAAAEELGDESKIVEATSMLARIFFCTGNLQDAQKLYSRAKWI